MTWKYLFWEKGWCFFVVEIVKGEEGDDMAFMSIGQMIWHFIQGLMFEVPTFYMPVAYLGKQPNCLE